MNTKKDYSPHFVFLPKKELEKKAIQTNLNNQGKLLISPLSGSEPKYDPNKWNLKTSIKNNHNCYSYAANHLNPGRKGKPQPGYFAGYDHIQDDEYKCENFYNRIRDDIPGSYLTSFEEPCEKGFHKAFMAIDDKKEGQDYHFYRQDNNGRWSHKPGRTEAQNIDASQKKITNPLTANRDYTHFAYKKPCFFFCVNPKLGRTHSKKINTKKSIFNFDF
jgi:hypothetical protein